MQAVIWLSKYIVFPVFIGVIATVCYVLIFDELLKKIVLPWYFSRKYKSTIIDGKWKGGNHSFDLDFLIHQTGDKVRGEITVKTVFRAKFPDGKTSPDKIIGSNYYIFDGEIKDGFVRIVHREKDRNSFGFGCFLFQIAGGGKVLNGSVVFVDESSTGYSVQTSEKIKLERK